jgi:ABC-type antimicrobial peptide transport system permease subunit
MNLIYLLIVAWGGVFLGICLGLLLARAIINEVKHSKTK